MQLLDRVVTSEAERYDIDLNDTSQLNAQDQFSGEGFSSPRLPNSLNSDEDDKVTVSSYNFRDHQIQKEISMLPMPNFSLAKNLSLVPEYQDKYEESKDSSQVSADSVDSADQSQTDVIEQFPNSNLQALADQQKGD